MEIRNNSLIVSPVSYTTSSGNNNNVDVKGTLIVVTTSNNNDAITGIIPFNDGHWIEIINNSSNVLVLSHNDSNSTSGNRFNTETQQSIYLAQNQRAGGFYQNGVYNIYRIGNKDVGWVSAYNDTTITFGAANTPTALSLVQNRNVKGFLSHSTSTNPSRIIANAPGIIRLTANIQMQWAGVIVGNANSYIWLRKNGSDIVRTEKVVNAPSPFQNSMNITHSEPMAINDYLEVVGSVGNTNITFPAAAAGGGGTSTSSINIEAFLIPTLP